MRWLSPRFAVRALSRCRIAPARRGKIGTGIMKDAFGKVVSQKSQPPARAKGQGADEAQREVNIRIHKPKIAHGAGKEEECEAFEGEEQEDARLRREALRRRRQWAPIQQGSPETIPWR